MKINKAHHRFLALTLAAFAALGVVNPAHAYFVYRGVTADANTHAVNWTAQSFGVSAGQHPPPPPPPPLPTLSFFHYASDNAARLARPNDQCFIKVDLPNTGANPNAGAADVVGIIGLGVGAAIGDQPVPFQWAIVFDDHPAGHWSIAKAAMSNAVSNAAASRVAAAGFHTLQGNAHGNVAVIDGSLANCVP